jgi:hypothetical protein
MGQEMPREWTAEIEYAGELVYAWFAFNPTLETFATELLDHARLFDSAADVQAWIDRLKVPNAAPVRVKDGAVVRPPIKRKGK